MTTMSARSRAAFEEARAIADAVLYEGYVLYPYRASARKNQLRWQFGVIAPKGFSDAGESDPWVRQTECVIESDADAVLDIQLRCLHVQSRLVEESVDGETFRNVESLEVDGRLFTVWDEAVEAEIDVVDLVLDPLDVRWKPEQAVPFTLDGADEVELIIADTGELAGRLVRRREPIAGVVRVSAEWLRGPYPLVKVQVRVENHTLWRGAEAPRDEVVRHSLVAAHTLLAVHCGEFVSMLDPPEFARPAIESCDNDGTFPVLAGEEGQRDVMLSSPIILYDYPEVAPESAGDLCDSTEIDEILALRVLTLTDDEKREARGTDARAAAIVDRIDAMPPEIFERLHGAVRSLRPAQSADREVRADADPPPWWDPGVDATFDPATDAAWVGGIEVRKGTRVRLCPRQRADAHDMFHDGREATVEAVFHDVDGEIHVGVTLVDDPGADLQQWQRRFLYFRPDEIEVLDP